MNAIAVIYVNQHLQELGAKARQRRFAASLDPKPSLRERLATRLATIRRALAADEIGPTVPQLSHWPYRV